MATYKHRNRVTIDGKTLSDVRKTLDVSLKVLADRLGCNQGSVSKWEQGKLVPSEERIWKMVEMFGTNSFVKVNPEYGKKRKYEHGGEVVRDRFGKFRPSEVKEKR